MPSSYQLLDIDVHYIVLSSPLRQWALRDESVSTVLCEKKHLIINCLEIRKVCRTNISIGLNARNA